MSSFLGRYLEPLPINSRGAFQILSATRADSGAGCVVLLPGSSADRGCVRQAFDEVERIHALVDDPRIPPVAARGEDAGTPWLELGCDAVLDGVEVLRMVSDSERKCPYGAADGFIASLRETMVAAQSRVDPRSGRPICLGRISAANTLFNAAGRWWLIGFGRNFPVEKDNGALDGRVVSFAAPEVSAGGDPSPMGDYVALLLFLRSLLPYSTIPGPLLEMFSGSSSPVAAAILTEMRWLEMEVVGAPARQRATLEEALASAERMRKLVGERRDPAAFAAFVARLRAECDEPQPMDPGVASDEGGARRTARVEAAGEAPASVAMALGPEAIWIAGPDGVRHRVGRALRRIVLALVERHQHRPGEPLTLWDLFEAGWPGERPVARAGANRVYVEISRLRKMGLRDIVERFDSGYRLSPRAAVRLEP